MGHIALLWHLHQPDYRDPRTGRPVLPWVRLHALRGYRDLFVETAEGGVRWTINVVPCLLDQLEAYAAGQTDDHLLTTERPAAEVDPAALMRLLAGHPAMTKAHPPYAALRARAEAGERLEIGERRDLQVWATLAWFGATARRDFPALDRLIQRGGGFSEADKQDVLDVHKQILREIPDHFRRAAEGPATISVSPYYHPILPLLVDVRVARRAMPELPEQDVFQYPEDARRQLVDARARAQALCGRAPIGLWPSEGSVSPEVVALAGEAGFRWLATDAGILERSERSEAKVPGGWDLGHGVIGFFRDTDLSDRIGFQYATRPAGEAAREWIALARERAGRGTLLVALDGENPWETYADAGHALRAHLIAALHQDGIGLDEASSHEPVGRVTRLHSGSWIGANFRIWAGHEEDRAAWRALGRTRAAVQAAPEEKRERALQALLPAEGSDWFWWYGDDFETVWADRFDELFRAHLLAAWAILECPPPEEVRRPIHRPRLPRGAAPSRLLPISDSGIWDWSSWAGAGEVAIGEGSMARGQAGARIRYGWSRDGRLWVRIDLRGPAQDWTFDPAPDVVFRAERSLIGAYAGGQASASLVSVHGERWPDLPLSFPAPPDGVLHWWTL